MDLYAHIISFDWEQALFAYDFQAAGFVELELIGPDGTQTLKSREAAGLGRLALTDLRPDAVYRWTARCGDRERSGEFRTLEAPTGEKRGEFMLIADPHISASPENRKGRFFVESALILADTVEQCNALPLDAVLGAGDITNHGLPEEYRRAAAILGELTAPQLQVPGNHDFNSPHGREDFGRSFGSLPDELALPYGTVLGLDTGDALLSERDAGRLRRALAGEAEWIFIVTHYQLYFNPQIQGPARSVIANAAEHETLLTELAADPRTVVYAGHQNIPLQLALPGGGAQINLPQPCQYPGGSLRCRVYGNGLYHTFAPITSEVWRQDSRRAGNAAAAFYEEPHWREEYREGTGTNFLHKNR